MKYFVRGWFEDAKQYKKTLKEYDKYYQIIEKELSDNVKKVLHNRHDTHIVRTYFEDKNYVMELDEKDWGKVKLVFNNANVKNNLIIQNEYWLYDEIYKVLDKIEIHILFNKSEIIIVCNDVNITIEGKEYFSKLYKISHMELDLYSELFNNKKGIANIVVDKEKVCGKDSLTSWEQLVFSYTQIYQHINFYKYNDIDFLIENNYYNYSEKEKKEIYVQLFENLEKRIIKSIKILIKYKEILKNEDLNYIIYRLRGIYDKKDIPIKEKNQRYLKLNEELNFDFNMIYKRILDCISKGLIK